MTRRPLPLARLEGLLPCERGLTSAEASERRRRYGPNDIVEAPPGRWWDLARETVRDPMIWFLAGVSALYGVVGEIAEALVLLAAIAPLAGMDAFLHRRTQASTQSLKSRLAARATVVRDGVPTEVPALEVAPGDLAVVSPAEAFPADGIIVGGSDLQADESSLTGEAYPVAKRPLTGSPEPGPEPPVDAAHWGFAGTRLLTGRAVLRVVFTGAETLYGEIVRSAGHGAHARTPLQSAIQHLVSVLLVAAAVVCAILAAVRMVQGHGWLDALLSAVTLAAAAIPEEFPVVFAFFLGVGVYRLARRQALVRRAVAVENIGRVTAICSDKTGTLTEGRLRLTHLVAADPLSNAELLALAAGASRRDSGDPLDEAVLREADAAGAGKNGREVLATFPFTESRRRETVIARDAGGNTVAVTKGAAETILGMAEAEAAERELWNGRVARLAEDGHKVIACAWRPVHEWKGPGGEPEQGYRLAGLLAFEDPVRDGVAEAIGACRRAGVHAIMVTGDHPLTARAVAREVGLGVPAPRVVSGEDMEALVARGEGRALRDIDVVARATPAQKLTLVRALQALHEIVAVTGDGVNDVPALQAADVGIAMGERGTRSAREVAALVLLDDNFRTIVGAIAEGRQLFQNLRTSFAYLLMIHLPFVASALVVPLLGYPLLYLPVHVVWIELIVHPTALLVFQEMPAGRLGSAGRRAPTRFFSPREWTAIALVGGVIALVAIGAYAWNVQERGSAEHGRAMAIATLAFASVALTARLSGLRTLTTRVIAAATAASTIIAIQTPLLAAMLHLEPLHLLDWGVAIAGSLLAAGLSWGSPVRPRSPVGSFLLGLLLPAAALAQAEDPVVVFAANIEKCKAHLAVSAELYVKGDRAAALHASHPIQEIGNKVIGPAAKTSPELGDKVRAALRRPSADLAGTTSPGQYERVVRETAATLDEAVGRVVPKERQSSLAFRARVLADLLTGMVTEYEEAYKAGTITQMVEYQDAYGFFRRARAGHRDLAPALRAKNPASAGELDGQFAALAKALPGLTPPASPVPAARMQAMVAAMVKSLVSASE